VRKSLLIFAATAFAAAAPLQAATHRCEAMLPGNIALRLSFESDGKAFTGLAMALAQASGPSMRECDVASLAGDGKSRWASDARGSFARIEDDVTGTVRVSITPNDGSWMVATAGKPGEDAICGTLALPPVLFITLTGRDGCQATLPGQPATRRP
jgi:hypothetical protein